MTLNVYFFVKSLAYDILIIIEFFFKYLVPYFLLFQYYTFTKNSVLIAKRRLIKLIIK